MRVLITGGLGFIGQNLATYLRRLEKDIELVALDWFEDACSTEFEDACSTEKALFDEVHTSCFVADEIMDQYLTADVVVHLAAYTTVQESILNPLRSFNNNVVKTQKLLEFLRLNTPETKLVFASTGGAIIGDYDGAINERIAANPLSPYGANKLAVEGLLSAYAGSYGLNTASMRFSNVYGPHSWRKSSVVSSFSRMYLQEGVLQINGDGLQTRDYIFVDDICDAIYRVIRKDGRGVFQLGTGIGTSILEIADIFKSLDPSRKTELKYVDGLPGEVRHNKADISRIRSELNFNPNFTVQRGIRNTVDWFKNYKNTLVEKS